MFPYKLLPADHGIMLTTALLHFVQEDNFKTKIIICDEVHFHLRKLLYLHKVTLWRGICNDKVIHPYCFEDADCIVLGDVKRDNLAELSLEQDGATAHTTGATMEILRHQFPNRPHRQI